MDTTIQKKRLTKEERAVLKAKAALKAKKDEEKELKRIEKEKSIFDANDEEYINGNPWYFKGEILKSTMLDSKMHGFIYVIEEISTGKMYIGQKQLWTKKARTVNKKTKKHIVESDWKIYYGSSAYIIDKVQREGTSDFKRYVISFVSSTGMLNYLEMKYQMDVRVLENEHLFINGYIGGRISRGHISMDKILDTDNVMLESIYKKLIK